MRKRYFFILLSIILLLIIIAFIVLKFFDNDVKDIGRIQDEFNKRYFTSFEYTEKYQDDSGKTIYCFVWSENDSIVIEANLEWTFDTILTFLPRKVVKDNFSEVLKKFIVTSKCGGALNITGDDIKTTGQIIYNLMREVRKQMSMYHKPTTFFSDDIKLLINYKDKSQEVIFYDYDINTINSQLKDLIASITDNVV